MIQKIPYDGTFIYTLKVDEELIIALPLWEWSYKLKDIEEQYDQIKEDFKKSLLSAGMEDHDAEIYSTELIKHID